VVCCSGTGNLNGDLFVRRLKECYFPDLDAKIVAIKQRIALAILLTDNCGIHTIDEVKKLHDKQLIQWAKTKLTPSQYVLDAFDAFQRANFIKTIQAAFRFAGIGFEVVRGTIVAKIDVQRFENIIMKLTADNTMTSGPRPSPKRKSTKKSFGVIKVDYLKKK
ncbi:MAG: hypothetical protein EZS28_030192, partial [Streblomastix strix]